MSVHHSCQGGNPVSGNPGGKSGFSSEWHSVKLNTLGFKVLRRKAPAHQLIINNMISISLDPKPRVSEDYSIFNIRKSVDLC